MHSLPGRCRSQERQPTVQVVQDTATAQAEQAQAEQRHLQQQQDAAAEARQTQQLQPQQDSDRSAAAVAATELHPLYSTQAHETLLQQHLQNASQAQATEIAGPAGSSQQSQALQVARGRSTNETEPLTAQAAGSASALANAAVICFCYNRQGRAPTHSPA